MLEKLLCVSSAVRYVYVCVCGEGGDGGNGNRKKRREGENCAQTNCAGVFSSLREVSDVYLALAQLLYEHN
jgi:hypothetical protein